MIWEIVATCSETLDSSVPSKDLFMDLPSFFLVVCLFYCGL